MTPNIAPDKSTCGQRAAVAGAHLISAAIAARGHAHIIVATGASQFEMLSHLSQLPDLPWDKITGFHLDEYVGLPISHPASFRRYLWERFVSRLSLPMRAFHFLNGEGDSRQECERVGQILAAHPIDVAFIGIGENGHIAFNDPPADFETESPYLRVALDEACRQQQLGEGWFPNFASVPTHAISMSPRQILKSQHIICTVPEERKAVAVKNTLTGPVTPQVPASILQTHSSWQLFLDQGAASLL